MEGLYYYSINLNEGSKTSYQDVEYKKYMKSFSWGYYDTLTLTIDKVKGNFGVTINDKWKGWAYENQYAIRHKEIYLGISSYADEGCEIEILNKDLITAERYHSDFSGIKNKSLVTMNQKGQLKCYDTLLFYYNNLYQNKETTIDVSVDLKYDNRVLKEQL